MGAKHLCIFCGQSSPQLHRTGSRIGWLLLPIPWIWRRQWDWTAAITAWRIAFSPEKGQ